MPLQHKLGDEVYFTQQGRDCFTDLPEVDQIWIVTEVFFGRTPWPYRVGREGVETANSGVLVNEYEICKAQGPW